MSLQIKLHDQNQRPMGVTEFSGREIVRNISGWKGGTMVGNMPVGGCFLLSVVSDKLGGRSLLLIGIGK